MKKILYLMLGALLFLSLMTACENLTACENFEPAGVTEREFWGETLVDQAQVNKFSPTKLYGEWKFQSTQIEYWEDGHLVKVEDRDNWFPYKDLSIKENGSLGAEGMTGGRWKYQYNCLFIDLSGHGGSSYFYEVSEVSQSKMVLREESYSIGGPVVTFLQDPRGSHIFCRFTYVR